MKLHKNSSKRIYFPGAIYYIVIKTEYNYPYFEEEIFCDLFIENLKICKELKHFKLYAFSLIYDHVNLILEPSNEFNVSKTIKSFKENLSRNINIVMGYTINQNSPLFEGETTSFRPQGLRKKFFNLFKGNFDDISYNKIHIDQYKNKFVEKFRGSNPYPEFKWQLSFYDHYIRFHKNHLKKQKDWDFHYNYTVYNHLKHGLPENWKYTSLNYPEMINSFEC
jgi:REP element-mobilizing transposase RayT